MTRRTVETRGFVTWPTCVPGDSWADDAEPDAIYDSREGGMECWLIVQRQYPKPPKSVREVCITGFEVAIVSWDALPGEDDVTLDLDSDAMPVMDKRPPKERTWPFVECAICIGATGASPFHGGGDVWQATYADLNAEGKQLFDSIAKLYDTMPVLVMVLDT